MEHGPQRPKIAVILPTRGRGTRVLAAVESIRGGTWQDFEICVVDQSSDRATEAAMRDGAGDDRVRYLRHEGLGLACGLNHGLDRSSAELIALTGDDCVTDIDWLERIVKAFETDARVGVVHGNVEAGRHDARTEFVQASVRSGPIVATSVADFAKLVGTSANMAFRRVTFAAIGGFDESLGVGAPLCAGEDIDFVLRALAGGWHVREDPRIRVTHLDAVPLGCTSGLIRRNWFGTGAVLAKLTRLHPLAAVSLGARLAARWIMRPVGVSSSLVGGGHRRARFTAVCRGFLVGLRWPVDRSTGRFRRLSGSDGPDRARVPLHGLDAG